MANKIAAGEVVERPASVVKELVENAIDAGARRIAITITQGGRKLIAVQDDGCGMTKDDALLSLERQATSKIRDVTDIEAIDTLGIEGRTIGIAPVGCSVLAYDYFTCDMVEASHGRAPAVATGVKRSLPDNIVFTYQGDGDLASIGLCETVSAAARGENITVIFVNNAIYGMTGGQMAPTSLPGQITQTSPYGRDVNTCGWPIRICEMLATLEAPAYLERVTVNNVKNVKNAKKAIEKAFRYQVEGKGFSLIEVLSACPTNWGLTPQKALEWIDEKMIPYYPLGVYRDKEG